jgi:hypothetical protein
VTQMRGFEFFQACCFGIESDDDDCVQNSKRRRNERACIVWIWSVGRWVFGRGKWKEEEGNARTRGQERERHTMRTDGERERGDGGALSLAPSFHETVRSPKNSVRPTQRRPARPPKLQPDYVLSAQSIKYSINEGVMNSEPPHSNSLMTNENDTEDGIQEGQERGGTTR